MLLNCDLGEMDNDLSVELQVMPHIHSANIVCGGHAGDTSSMHRCVELALAHGVVIAAHPSYPDKANFGRKSMKMNPEMLHASLHEQITTLHEICTELGSGLGYVKPHGALYNDLIHHTELRALVMQTLEQSPCKTLMLQATPSNREHQREAESLGVELLFEAFVDRRYQDNAALLPRGEPQAVLDRADDILAQTRQLVQDGSVETCGGKRLSLSFDSLCLHGDNPAAVTEVQHIRELVDKAVGVGRA